MNKVPSGRVANFALLTINSEGLNGFSHLFTSPNDELVYFGGLTMTAPPVYFPRLISTGSELSKVVGLNSDKKYLRLAEQHDC